MMMKTGNCIAVLAIATALAAPVAGQENLTLSERVERLERQSQGSAGGGTADLVIQLNQLQQEVRELRGLVEQQQHEIESLKARQRDQYLDLDQRLQGLSASPAPSQSTDRTVQDERDESVRPPEGSAAPAGQAQEPADTSGGAGTGQPSTGNGEPVPDQAARQAAYDRAFEKLRDGSYAEAAEAFRSFLEQYPDGPLADNAQYWLGESYYVTGNFDIALNAFQSVLSGFPESPKAPDAHLKLGFCYYELEQWDQARETLDEVTRKYPESAVSRLAQNRLRLMRIEGH